MVSLAARAMASRDFDEKLLRLSLAEIARRSYGDGNTVNHALKQGWKQGVSHAMADGIVSQAEEAMPRATLCPSRSKPVKGAEIMGHRGGVIVYNCRDDRRQ